MIITGGASGEQLCWSEPWIRFSARTIVSALQDAVEADPGTEVTVDLGRREVRAGRSWAAGASGTGGAAGAARAESAGGAEGAAGIRAPFEIDEHTRWRLMEGLDDIGLTLRHVEEITAFERSRPAWLPVTS